MQAEVFVAEPFDDDPGSPTYWQKLFAEASTPFEAEPELKPTLETLRSLYASVLAGYGYTCAMTGRRYAPPQELLHEDLQLVPIRPLSSGGALHVSNFLCLETDAANAFRAGHLAIGPALQLLADLSVVDPELLERLNPIGRLSLPHADVAQPDPLALAYHREHIFLH